MADVDVKKVKDLMAQKDAIEEEIKELSEVLESVSLYCWSLLIYNDNCFYSKRIKTVCHTRHDSGFFAQYASLH